MKTDELKPKEEYAIRTPTPEEKERMNPEDSDIPAYRIDIDLSDDDSKRLVEQFFMEYEAIKTEREPLEAKWKQLDALYYGEMADNKLIPFNLSVFQAKIKEDAIVRACKEAFLDSDPIVDVSPRPETERQDGNDVARRQAEFIDYAMDEEIKPESAFDKIFRSAVRKFVGIGKISWAYRIEKRRREETYEGKNIPTQVMGGRLILKNEGVEQFMRAYPDGLDKYKGYLKQLLKEKRISIVVNYKDTVENNAKLKHIKVEDFYVRNGCEYLEGLRYEHCVVERQAYTYWELLKKEADGEFKDVEDLWGVDGADSDKVKPQDYQTKTYDILEATMYFKLKEGEDEVKIKAWFGEEKKVLLGVILYPYYAFDIDYIPLYTELNEYGFYGDARSSLSYLKDSNLAQNILLNLALYGLYLRNTITPIVKEGSQVEQMFLDKQWQSGAPLVVDDLTDDVNKGVGFVQWPNIDLQTYLTLSETLRRGDSDVSKVSDLTSGRESVIDPNAPAQKTMALLQQSGLGVKEYIRTLLPSFNTFCSMILQIYYQMSQDSRKFRVRPKSEGVTGIDVFGQISRDEMIVKTNIQARASAFVFDKIGEKQEAVAAWNMIRNDTYLQTQPEVLFETIKNVMEVFGAKWKNLSEKVLDPEEFKKRQMMIAMQAVQMLAQQAQQEQQVTGVPSQVTPEDAGQAVTKAQAVAYNPTLAQEKK